MLTTETTLDIDLAELCGPLLVAEVEAYLRTVAPVPAWRSRLRQAVAERAAPTPGRTDTAPAGPWGAGYPTPTPTLSDRLLRRRLTVAVTAVQHLELMDRYIAERGWTQGRLWDEQGRVCVLGAHLQVLAHGYGTPATAWQARLLIGNALGYQGTPVPVDTWNDRPTTRQADIHHLLHTAAARPQRRTT